MVYSWVCKHLYLYARSRRTSGHPGDRSPVRVRLYRTPLPNLLASAEGQSPTTIAHDLRCTDQTVRNALHAFHQRGLAALQPQSSRPTPAPRSLPGSLRVPAGAVTPEPTDIRQADEPVDPRTGRRGQFCPGAHPRLVSDEAIRVALRRLRVSWKRAKHWITSPDPAYARKKNGGTS